MSFREFNQDLTERKLKNICLLWGKEGYLVEWAQRQILQTFAGDMTNPMDVTEFSGDEMDAYRIVEACETLPFLSAKRIVVVEHLPSLEGNPAIIGEDSLTGYVRNPSETTMLVLVCGEKVDKRKSIFKEAVKHGSVYEFSTLNNKELAAWIRKRCKSYGKSMDAHTMQHFVERSGYYDKDSQYTLHHFENDLSKIVLHCDDETIRPEDVDVAVMGNMNANVFALIDRIAAGNRKEAYDMLGDLLRYGESEYGILALLCRQYENVLHVKQLQREGRSKNEMVEMLKSRGFIVERWIAAGRTYSEEELRRILQRLYATDQSIKSGNINSRIALEWIVGTIGRQK